MLTFGLATYRRVRIYTVAFGQFIYRRRDDFAATMSIMLADEEKKCYTNLVTIKFRRGRDNEENGSRN